MADDLHRIIAQGNQQRLLELNMELHHLVVEFMDLPIVTSVATTQDEVEMALDSGACDMRGKMGGKKGDSLPIDNVPYYQMWSQRHGGFTAGLSILDLLMNEGREGVFTLLKMAKNLNLDNTQI